MKNAIQEALLIILVSVAVSLVVNALRPEGIRLFAHHEDSTIVHQDEVKEISMDDAISKYSTQAVLFADARLSDAYRKGHIKGAVNLPDQHFDNWIDEIIQQVDPQTEIVTYCSGIDCSQAKDLAEKLSQTGFTRVWYFPGGYDLWIKNRLPTEKDLPQ